MEARDYFRLHVTDFFRGIRGNADFLIRFGAIALSLMMFGCGGEESDLGERVTQMQKEIEQNRTELQTTKQALAAADAELMRLRTLSGTKAGQERMSSDIQSSEASKEAIEESYTVAVRRMEKQLRAELTDSTVDAITLHSIVLAPQQYPITSQISFSVRSSDGTPYELNFPVKANLRGEWTFPETSEIIHRFDEMRRGKGGRTASAPSSSARVNSAPTVQPTLRPSRPVSGLPPTGDTVIIQWPDAGQSPRP